MKLLGNLKNQVENAKSKEEAKSLIEKAGMALNADELEMVTGGGSVFVGAQLDLTNHGLGRYDKLEKSEWELHQGPNRKVYLSEE